ncbi:BlaI/MecI/CopY family transcriptional regulator [Flindersiella endophytica]
MRAFGELEAAIMRCLWSSDEVMTVREVRDALSEERDCAYTTVMTVMDNLHTKGWVEREKSGKAFWYWPAATQEEYTAGLMTEALGTSVDRQAAFLHFVSEISAEDADALRRALRTLSRRKSARKPRPKRT